MQLELILATPAPAKPTLTLSDIIYGNVVQVTGSKKLVMRVKPTGILLNSNIIGDVINRNDCIVVDMAKGTCYYMRGTVPVTKMISKMLYAPLVADKES